MALTREGVATHTKYTEARQSYFLKCFIFGFPSCAFSLTFKILGCILNVSTFEGRVKPWQLKNL